MAEVVGILGLSKITRRLKFYQLGSFTYDFESAHAAKLFKRSEGKLDKTNGTLSVSFSRCDL